MAIIVKEFMLFKIKFLILLIYTQMGQLFYMYNSSSLALGLKEEIY